jgi:hypothetical protein
MRIHLSWEIQMKQFTAASVLDRTRKRALSGKLCLMTYTYIFEVREQRFSDCGLLDCDTVHWRKRIHSFWRNILTPSPGLKSAGWRILLPSLIMFRESEGRPFLLSAVSHYTLQQARVEGACSPWSCISAHKTIQYRDPEENYLYRLRFVFPSLFTWLFTDLTNYTLS